MSDLTVVQIKQMKAKESHYKVRVSKGLFVGIAKDGIKTFFIRYSAKGKQRDYSVPRVFGDKSDAGHITLADARSLAAQISAMGKAGIDYQEKLTLDASEAAKSAESHRTASLTVADLYTDWFSTLTRQDKGASIAAGFKTQILPLIGAKKLQDIEEGDIKATLKPISDSGHHRTAHVRLSELKQMFLWGTKRKPYKTVLDNPTSNLEVTDVTFAGYKETKRERTLSEDEIKHLASLLPDAKLPTYVEHAIYIALSCCTRIGETLMARWENVDFAASEWFIPEVDTKGKSPAHRVFLSEFARKQFEQLKEISGESEWCFPSMDGKTHIGVKTPTKLIADRQKDSPLQKRTSKSKSLLLTGGKWTPHDLRRTGATLMQRVKVDMHIADLVLNHAQPNKMMATYQHYDYWNEKVNAWQLLGQYLEGLVKQDDIFTETA